ncbi:phage tail protein [Oceanobacter mangrovi]|uniref:phage tail protein n=1 Tax=Oceanobacter mangrovi TaxID=2862510 RepID=UPI001C8ED432|nr:tail fiber protein [Oceanobacter mangrovi]
MDTALLGELGQLGFNFAPKGWALCNGALLPISENQALYALLGTTYGGDGRTTFGLPNLQSRMPIGIGEGAGMSEIEWGESAGAESVTLTVDQMPTHTHTASATFTPVSSSDVTITGALRACTDNATLSSPTEGDYIATAMSQSAQIPQYAAASAVNSGNTVSLGGLNVTAFVNEDAATGTVSVTNFNSGASQPFSIRNPYLGMNFVIATVGIVPSRN